MSPLNAAEIARDRKIEIYTIGVGNPEATGEEKVDLQTLQDIADRTGGRYFYAEDQSGLQQVYERIDALAPRKTETLSYRPRQALAWIPLLLAVLIGTGTTGFLALRSRPERMRA